MFSVGRIPHICQIVGPLTANVAPVMGAVMVYFHAPNLLTALRKGSFLWNRPLAMPHAPIAIGAIGNPPAIVSIDRIP